ncbi:MAG: hypothetical protein GY762_07590 [Proteobacteria bacterium]|nr:hypothetical protein [Pseudomonadota bacterium]
MRSIVGAGDVFSPAVIKEGGDMPVPRSLRWYKIALFAVAMAAIAVSCSDQEADQASPSRPMMVSRGIITASFNRYIETSLSDPLEQFSLIGMFVRHDVEETYAVESLFDFQMADVNLALDTCTMPARVLPNSTAHGPQSETTIELLDIGDLALRVNKEKMPIPTRTFPDLLKVIVGVIYTTDETQGGVFSPGETYDLQTTGTDEIAAFRVALEAPEDLGDVKVDGIKPGDQPIIVRHGGEMELVWEGDGYGDEVVATLSWMSMGAPWSMTCRMRDDGLFVISETYLAGMPDPLTCSYGEFTITRVRQVAFRSEDLSSGSFQFAVSTSFPVTF